MEPFHLILSQRDYDRFAATPEGRELIAMYNAVPATCITPQPESLQDAVTRVNNSTKRGIPAKVKVTCANR